MLLAVKAALQHLPSLVNNQCAGSHLGCLSTQGMWWLGSSMPKALARRLERFWRSHSASQVRMPEACPAGTAVCDTRRPHGHFSVTFRSGGGCGL